MCITICISLSGQSKQKFTRTEYFFMIYPSPQGYIDCPESGSGGKRGENANFLISERILMCDTSFCLYYLAKKQ